MNEYLINNSMNELVNAPNVSSFRRQSPIPDITRGCGFSARKILQDSATGMAISHGVLLASVATLMLVLPAAFKRSDYMPILLTLDLPVGWISLQGLLKCLWNQRCIGLSDLFNMPHHLISMKLLLKTLDVQGE